MIKTQYSREFWSIPVPNVDDMEKKFSVEYPQSCWHLQKERIWFKTTKSVWNIFELIDRVDEKKAKVDIIVQ